MLEATWVIFVFNELFFQVKELGGVPLMTKTAHMSNTIPDIEITSWKVRAYGFYSRVVKYHKTNERGFASE